MKEKEDAMVVSSEMLDEDVGGGYTISLYTQSGPLARVLAGLIGRWIQIDLAKTVNPQPDPQILHIVEKTGKPKK